MPRTDFKQLLDAGVHFGHLKRKWNPSMAPYIFMEKNGIHIIDLQKTIVKIATKAQRHKKKHQKLNLIFGETWSFSDLVAKN